MTSSQGTCSLTRRSSRSLRLQQGRLHRTCAVLRYSMRRLPSSRATPSCAPTGLYESQRLVTFALTNSVPRPMFMTRRTLGRGCCREVCRSNCAWMSRRWCEGATTCASSAVVARTGWGVAAVWHDDDERSVALVLATSFHSVVANSRSITSYWSQTYASTCKGSAVWMKCDHSQWVVILARHHSAAYPQRSCCAGARGRYCCKMGGALN